MTTSKFYRVFAAFLITALALCVHPRSGDAQIVYYNINSIVGYQNNGSAASTTGNTALTADDITFLNGYANSKVTSFTLAVSNSGSVTETAALTVEFFMIDGTGNGPGTLLASYSTGSIAFGANQTMATFTAPNLFTIPASGKIWAGFYFTGVSGSLTALNSLGGYYENAPTVGNSTSNVFLGSSPTTTGSNPSGTITSNPGGQGGNFGMAFSVPEPSSVALLALGGAGAVLVIVRRRRA